MQHNLEIFLFVAQNKQCATNVSIGINVAQYSKVLQFSKVAHINNVAQHHQNLRFSLLFIQS